MTGLTVTADQNGTLCVHFGDYAPSVIPFQVAYYKAGYMVKTHLMPDHILVWGEDVRTFSLIVSGGDASKGLIVDTINGQTPTDLNDLAQKISLLM
jgi:hypothetical protein